MRLQAEVAVGRPTFKGATRFNNVTPVCGFFGFILYTKDYIQYVVHTCLKGQHITTRCDARLRFLSVVQLSKKQHGSII